MNVSFGVFTAWQPSWKYVNQADNFLYNNTIFLKYKSAYYYLQFEPICKSLSRFWNCYCFHPDFDGYFGNMQIRIRKWDITKFFFFEICNQFGITFNLSLFAGRYLDFEIFTHHGHLGYMQIRKSKRGQKWLPYVRNQKGYFRGHLCQISWFLHKVHTGVHM